MVTDVVAAWKRDGMPGPGRAPPAPGHRLGLRAAVLRRLPCLTGGSSGSPRTHAGRAVAVAKHTVMDLDAWPPEAAARAAGGVGARADERRDLPWLHPWLPVLSGRDDHPPGARAIDHRHRRDGPAAWATGFEEVGLLSLSSADHTEIGG